MVDWKKHDGAILGAVAGLLATKSEISIWISTNLAKIIPASWLIFDSWSIPIFGILIGIIIGYIVDRR